jgi:hypothetical protein
MLEGIVSEDDVRFGEGFGNLFCARVVAVDNVRIGNPRRVLDQGLSVSTVTGARDNRIFFIGSLAPV